MQENLAFYGVVTILSAVLLLFALQSQADKNRENYSGKPNGKGGALSKYSNNKAIYNVNGAFIGLFAFIAYYGPFASMGEVYNYAISTTCSAIVVWLLFK